MFYRSIESLLQGIYHEYVKYSQTYSNTYIFHFTQVNNRFPDRIIIYRDGVGDGQLDTVKNFEVKQLESAFSSIAPDYKPRLTVIIVQKRINTRIFRQYVSFSFVAFIVMELEI